MQKGAASFAHFLLELPLLQRLIQTAKENERVKLTVDRQGNPFLVFINVGVRP